MEIQKIESYKFYSTQFIQLLQNGLIELQNQHDLIKQEEYKKQKRILNHVEEEGDNGARENHQYDNYLISSLNRHHRMDLEGNKEETNHKFEDADNDDIDDDIDDDDDMNDNNDNNVDDTQTSTKKKKKQIKKSTQEYQKQMGKPPSETLITQVQNDTNIAVALTIPTVLFPSSSSNGVSSNGNLSHFYQSAQEEKMNQDHLEPLLSLYHLANSLSSTTTPPPPTTTTTSNTTTTASNVLVILLQSGRFAAAIFNKGQCINHTTSNRYTVRKGQGGSQSANDNSKGKAKSVGSQLRRAGETQLRNDVYMTLQNWKRDIECCSLFFVSCSKMLLKGFWQDVDKIFGEGNNNNGNGFRKGSDQVKNIPLDVGRPCYESCCAAYDLLMTCSLLTIDLSIKYDNGNNNNNNNNNKYNNNYDNIETQPAATSLYPIQENENIQQNKPIVEEKVVVPLTALHEAARDGNVEEIASLLSSSRNGTHDDIDSIAGPKRMTPLHYAAASSSSSTSLSTNSLEVNPNIDHATAAKCVMLLLTQGHANPCIPDAHNRPPYYLAPNDTIRNAFRKARSELGEEIWDWDDGAKVGPALTNEDLKNKRDKAAEKKRRQRMRQKEKKALEQQEAAEAERLAKEAEEKKQEEDNARRVRAGLKPKSVSEDGLTCDFCQKDCKGKRKSQLFSRLDFLYCSSNCMRNHQRELMAAAATARMKSS